MTFDDVAKRLQALRIPCGVTVYENGYAAQILNPHFFNEFLPMCNTLDEAAQYLHAAAKRLYPDTYGKDEA